MYAAPGVGLAATQVDVHKRIIVIDISEARDELRVFVNPEIVAAEGEAEREEGCLSVPGYYERGDAARRTVARARAGCDRASRSSSTPTACSPCASSTRWNTSRARSSSTTCRR